MAIAAGFLMAAMMVVTCIDVVLPNLGYQSSAHFFTFTAYALLAVPCLGAPWLVREKGHIYVEILLMYLQPRPRKLLTCVIGGVCIAVCGILAWYGFEVAISDFLQNEKDVRSLDMRSEEHTSELQSRLHLVCRLLLEKKKKTPSATGGDNHRYDDQTRTG